MSLTSPTALYAARERRDRNFEKAKSMDPEYDFERIVEEVAESLGCKIIRPGKHELFLDFDTEQQFSDLPDKLADLFQEKGYTMKHGPSKSGLPRRHVIVTVPAREFTPSERVLFQLLLGSDPKREFLDGRRLLHGVTAENTTCFFEPIK